MCVLYIHYTYYICHIQYNVYYTYYSIYTGLISLTLSFFKKIIQFVFHLLLISFYLPSGCTWFLQCYKHKKEDFFFFLSDAPPVFPWKQCICENSVSSGNQCARETFKKVQDTIFYHYVLRHYVCVISLFSQLSSQPPIYGSLECLLYARSWASCFKNFVYVNLTIICEIAKWLQS